MKAIAILLLPVFLNGCAAIVATAAVSYRDSLAPGQRAAFKADYDKRNAERMEAGQEPVKWCDALHRYNLRWYAQDPTCK